MLPNWVKDVIDLLEFTNVLHNVSTATVPSGVPGHLDSQP